MKLHHIAATAIVYMLSSSSVLAQTQVPIPEPSLWSLLGIGAVGLIAMRLRNRK